MPGCQCVASFGSILRYNDCRVGTHDIREVTVAPFSSKSAASDTLAVEIERHLKAAAFTASSADGLCQLQVTRRQIHCT